MFSFGVDAAQPATKFAPPPSPICVTDDEARKRSTDCIYFLASPLTCKKGGSCEFRHSDAARMNPRDCRFWKTGSCLNPRCSFRHVPLEEKPASSLTSSSRPATTTVPQSTALTVSATKSKTPCYFFSQGYCAKNDKCPFVHIAPTAAQGDVAKTLAVAGSGKSQSNIQKLPNGLKESGTIDCRPTSVNDLLASKPAPMPLPTFQSSNCLKGSDKKMRPSNSVMPCKQNSENNVQDCRLHVTDQSQLKVEETAGLFDTTNSLVGSQIIRDRFPKGNPSVDHSTHNTNIYQNGKSPSNTTTSSQHDLVSTQHMPEIVALHSGLSSMQRETLSRLSVDSSLFQTRGTERRKRQRKDFTEQQIQSKQRKDFAEQPIQSNRSTLHGKAEAKGNTDLITNAWERQQLWEKHLNVVRENPLPLQMASSSKVSNSDKGQVKDDRQRGLIQGTCLQENKSFTGPKSLAQIKAEKMAGGKSLLHDVRSREICSAPCETSKISSVPMQKAKSSQIADKCSMKAAIAAKPAEDTKRMAQPSEFEGPKPLSVLLQRKRELQVQSNGSETSSALHKAEATVVDSSRELEEGEVGGDCIDHEEVNLPPCNSVLAQEDLQPISLSSREMINGAVDAIDASFAVELNSDAEMEDVVSSDTATDDYGNFDMDDEDDDDEDFAKKLGRVFALSSD